MFTLLVLVGSGSAVIAQWHETTSHNPWSVEIGGKFYDRPGSKLDIPIITDSITRTTLFDAGDATDLGNGPAAEVKFTFKSKTGQEWEARSIIGNWNESIDPIAGPNIESPFFPDGAFNINQFDYSYDAELFSLELMKRRAFQPGFVWMFGPRFLSSRNTVTHETTATLNPGGGVPSFQVSRESVASAKNTLMGLQAGLEINRPISNGLYISGFARAGGYFNPTKVQTRTTDSFFGVIESSKRTKSTESFLGEAGGRLYMDLVPNVFSSYIGYEANWIDGFAAAPEQVLRGFGPDNSIETTNTIFFHGITFGVKYTY
jgi:hypothetical protein